MRGSLLAMLLALGCAPSSTTPVDPPPIADLATWRAARAQAVDEAGRSFLQPEEGPQGGRWRMPREDGRDGEAAALESIGYADGTMVAPARSGVTVHRPEAFAAPNLVVSGHGPEALLMDMDGNVLHRWRREYLSVFDPEHRERLSKERYRDFLRRAAVLPDGDLVALFEGTLLVRLDKGSEVEWWTRAPRPHHDFHLTEDGRVFALTRKSSIDPRVNAEELVLADFVSVFRDAGDGKAEELSRTSVLDCFLGSRYEHLLERADDRGDIFHTNTIEVLDGRFAHLHPAFRKGNVLVSLLRLDVICVLDLENEDVPWALTGSWVRQHQPTFLDDGSLLLFDNLGGDAEGGRSRVLELDPLTGEILWSYEGDARAPFQTDFCGSAQRLPNGNTLVTESDNGRAFEVTRAGEVVWELVNPRRAGSDDELIATLFEVVRLPADFPLDWVGSSD